MTYPIETLPALAVAENLPTYILDDTLAILTAEKAATNSPEDFAASSYRLGCTYIDRGLAAESDSEAQNYFDTCEEHFDNTMNITSSLQIVPVRAAIMLRQLPLIRSRKGGEALSAEQRRAMIVDIDQEWERCSNKLTDASAAMMRIIINSQRIGYLLSSYMYPEVPVYISGARESQDGFKLDVNAKQDQIKKAQLIQDRRRHAHTFYTFEGAIKVPMQFRARPRSDICPKVLCTGLELLMRNHYRHAAGLGGSYKGWLYRTTVQWLARESRLETLAYNEQTYLSNMRYEVACRHYDYSARLCEDKAILCDHDAPAMA